MEIDQQEGSSSASDSKHSATAPTLPIIPENLQLLEPPRGPLPTAATENWTTDEDAELFEAASDFSQNWNLVCDSINTKRRHLWGPKRTPPECFMRLQKLLKDPKRLSLVMTRPTPSAGDEEREETKRKLVNQFSVYDHVKRMGGIKPQFALPPPPQKKISLVAHDSHSIAAAEAGVVPNSKHLSPFELAQRIAHHHQQMLLHQQMQAGMSVVGSPMMASQFGGPPGGFPPGQPHSGPPHPGMMGAPHPHPMTNIPPPLHSPQIGLHPPASGPPMHPGVQGRPPSMMPPGVGGLPHHGPPPPHMGRGMTMGRPIGFPGGPNHPGGIPNGGALSNSPVMANMPVSNPNQQPQTPYGYHQPPTPQGATPDMQTPTSPTRVPPGRGRGMLVGDTPPGYMGRGGPGGPSPVGQMGPGQPNFSGPGRPLHPGGGPPVGPMTPLSGMPGRAPLQGHPGQLSQGLPHTQHTQQIQQQLKQLQQLQQLQQRQQQQHAYSPLDTGPQGELNLDQPPQPGPGMRGLQASAAGHQQHPNGPRHAPTPTSQPESPASPASPASPGDETPKRGKGKPTKATPKQKGSKAGTPKG